MTSKILENFIRDYVLPRSYEIPPSVRDLCSQVPMGTRLAGNPRVSTEAQIAGQSLPEQQEAFERFALSHNLTVVWIQEDAGVTGRDITQRDGLLRLLAGVVEGIFDAVAVYDLTRLSRRTTEGGVVIDLLDEYGAKLVTWNTVYDLSREGDRSQIGMLLVFAEQEYRINRTRVMAGRKRKRDHGGWPGGQAPYGYELPKRRSKAPPEIIQEEAEVVRHVLLNLYPNHSDDEIARILENEGHTHRGRPWNPTRIYDMHRVRRRNSITKDRLLFYAGRQYNSEGEIIHAVWEPILNDEEYRYLVNVRDERSRGPQPRARRYLLSGLGISRCGKCGSPILGSQQRRRRPSRDDYYVHEVYRCGRRPGCGIGRNYNVQQTDFIVLASISHTVKELGETHKIIQAQEAQSVERFHRELESIEGKLKHYVKAIGEGIDLEGVKVEIEKLRTQKRHIITLLDSSQAVKLATANELRVIKEILESERLLQEDPDLARKAVKLMVRSIIFGPGGTIQLRWFDDAVTDLPVPSRKIPFDKLSRIGAASRWGKRR